MTLQDWGAIGEMIGGVAVIASLLYLSIQIRQNNRMMKANFKQSITDATQLLIYKLIEESEVADKIISGKALEEHEKIKAWLMMRAMLLGYEVQIYQHELGLLDESEWRNLQRVIIESVNYPGFASLWPDYIDQVSDRLREVVEQNHL